MIEVEAPDGSIVEFPDGTEVEVINKAMAAKFGGPSAPSQDADPIRAQAEAMANRIEESAGPMGAGGLFKNAFALGLNDKITGGMEGIAEMLRGGSFGEGYKRGSLAEQIMEERARERSGTTGAASEIAGTILTGTLARAPAAADWLPRILQTGKEAATLGAVQGVGDSTQDNIGGVLGDAAISGGLSALIGGGFQGGVELGRGLVKGGVNAYRALASLVDNPQGKATKRIVQSLADDGLTPQKAVNRMARADTNLVSVAGDTTTGLGRAVSARPGPGRNIINKALDRLQATRANRVVEAVNSALGGRDVPFNTRVSNMILSRASKAKKAYDTAFARNFGKHHSMAFDDIARRVPASAVRDAQLIAKTENRPFGEQLIASIDDMTGDVVFARQPSIREWHYIQRGLRSAADTAFRGGRGEVGTAYKRLHKELLRLMDEANPTYKMARNAYASESQLIEALQRGRDIIKPATLNNLDQFADDFASMSRPEREMVRTGLARAMEDLAFSTPSEAGDVVRKIFGTPQKRAAIRAVFDNASDFRKFEVRMGQLMREAGVFKNIRTGSRTSFVDAEKQAFGTLNDVAETAVDMARGGYVNATMRGLSKLLGNLGGMDETTAAAVAKILTETDPNLVLQALSAGGKTNAGNPAIEALMTKAAQIARTMAVGAGAGSGSAIATLQ